MKRGKKYSWQRWRTGRSIRSDTDHAVTYALDSNFPWFVRRHGELFPEYFLEVLVATTRVHHASAKLSKVQTAAAQNPRERVFDKGDQL